MAWPLLPRKPCSNWTALRRLEALDPRACRVVEMRYFGGLTEREVAAVAGVSVATLKRDWDFARAWLIRQLRAR
jgi:DNA-directed RNA polymerase specialized sigma24 family protein